MPAMKPQIILTVLLSFTSSTVLAGTVRFEPAVVQIDPSNSTTTTTLKVYVDSSDTLVSFDAVDMLIGSNDLAVGEFAFDPTFDAATVLRTTTPQGSGSPYASGRSVGGLALTSLTAPLLVGTLTIDAAGLSNGTYTVMVDANADGGRSTLASSSTLVDLFGNATINVVGSTVPPGTSVGCSADADCNGAGACTSVACVDSLCVSTMIQDCKTCGADSDCSDGNPCSTGTCVADLCRYAANSGSCDDGDPCTQNDVCSAFACDGTAIAGCNGSAGGTPVTTGLCGSTSMVMLLGILLSLNVVRRTNRRRRAPR